MLWTRIQTEEWKTVPVFGMESSGHRIFHYHGVLFVDFKGSSSNVILLYRIMLDLMQLIWFMTFLVVGMGKFCNACPQWAWLSVKQLLPSKSITVHQHLPCSSGSASCNFFLFSKIKSALKGIHFEMVEEPDGKRYTEMFWAVESHYFCVRPRILWY